MSEHNDTAATHNEGYDRQSVNLRTIIMTTIAGVMIVVFSVIGLNEYFFVVKEDLVYELDLSRPPKELMELQEREAKILGSYGIVDSVNQVYHIPIEKAMEQMVAEHNVEEK